jgi:predicted membrane protein
VGDRAFVVESQDELATRYEIGMGDLRLVLGDLVLVESAEVEVAVGAGELVLIVPEAVPVSIEATVGAGEIEMFGETVDGFSVVERHVSPGFDEAPATLTLDLDVAAGRIEVRR